MYVPKSTPKTLDLEILENQKGRSSKMVSIRNVVFMERTFYATKGQHWSHPPCSPLNFDPSSFSVFIVLMARLLTNCLGRPPGCHGIYYNVSPCIPVCHGPFLHVDGPGIRDRPRNHVQNGARTRGTNYQSKLIKFYLFFTPVSTVFFNDLNWAILSNL